MLYLVLTMLVILLVAAAVVVYAAYPHRGERLPAAPWLGEAMARAVRAAPTLRDEDADRAPAPADSRH